MTNYQVNDSLQTTSKYQFSGPRYEKKDTIAGKSATTRYYVDAGHRLLSEKTIDDSGIKEYSYVYLGSQKLARISQNDASKKDEISYFLTDAIGSVAMTTYQHTASTNVPIQISQSLLDPWGNSVRNGMFYHTAQQDFTGKVLDEVSGLYDFGFRYYDPLTAAWIGKDLVPADHNAPLSLNEYLYCLINPTIRVDPDGRKDYIYSDHKNYTVENDWGMFEWMNTDRYFAESDGKRYRANSKETVTHKQWNKIEDNGWFDSSLARGLNNVSRNPLWILRESQNKRQLDQKRNLDETTLYLQEGTLYNWREAGNYVWGAAMARLGYPDFIQYLGAQAYSAIANRQPDEPWEVDAFRKGSKYMQENGNQYQLNGKRK